MKRYIAQFKPWTGGLYVVMHCVSATERYQIGEPKPYHEANDEAEARNNGTFGQPQIIEGEWSVISSAFTNWLPGTFIKP